MAVNIISHEGRIFRDRVEAGRVLAEYLEGTVPPDTLVLAIPRGGVVVGGEIADALGCELDVLIVKKIGAPFNKELAIGSLLEGSTEPYLSETLIEELGIGDEYIDQEVERQLRVAAAQAAEYRKVRDKAQIEGRHVIITDDGIATGATMMSSVLGVMMENPEHVTVALPIGPERSVIEIGDLVEEMLCISAPSNFAAVGQFYENFEQTTNEEVVRILRQHAPQPAH